MDGARGWRVVGGGFFAITITAGIMFFSVPVMIDPIIQDTAWSLTQITLGITIFGLSAALFSPPIGMLIDRLGARTTMIFGGVLGFIALLGIARVTALWQFYAFMVLLAIAAMSNTYIAVAAVVARWFVKQRGVATGVALLGLGVGGAIFPQVVSDLLESYDWRGVFSVLGFLLLLSLIPTVFFIRNPDEAEEEAYLKACGDEGGLENDLTMGEALTTRSFWGLSIGDMLTGVIYAVFNVTLIVFLTRDIGDEKTATNIYSTLQICIAFGTLIFGPLADVFKLRPVLVFCYALPAFATALLLVGGSIPLAFAFALIGGLAGGGRTALFPVALVHCFGEKHMGAIYGFSNIFFMVGTGVGPVIGGAIYEGTQNTQVVYGLCIGTLLVSAALVALIRNEQKNVREEF